MLDNPLHRDWLFKRYAYKGCPGAYMEDVCAHPDHCADMGCCQLIESNEHRTKGDFDV